MMRSYIVKRSSADHVDTILLILGQCTCKVYFYDLGRCWVSHVQWVFVTVDCAYTKGNLSTLGAAGDVTERIYVSGCRGRTRSPLRGVFRSMSLIISGLDQPGSYTTLHPCLHKYFYICTSQGMCYSPLPTE